MSLIVLAVHIYPSRYKSDSRDHTPDQSDPKYLHNLPDENNLVTFFHCLLKSEQRSFAASRMCQKFRWPANLATRPAKPRAHFVPLWFVFSRGSNLTELIRFILSLLVYRSVRALQKVRVRCHSSIQTGCAYIFVKGLCHYAYVIHVWNSC